MDKWKADFKNHVDNKFNEIEKTQDEQHKERLKNNATEIQKREEEHELKMKKIEEENKRTNSPIN